MQAFDAQTEHDIEGVRLTWSDDAGQQGIRLRTKLRLFGFETVETLSQEAAREGRNKTARHLPPQLVLAYGAARSDGNADETWKVLQRLAVQVPVRVAVGSGAAAAAVVGVGLYALGSPSQPEAPYSTAAEPTPALSEHELIPVPPAAPPTLAVPPAVAQPAEVPAPSQTAEPVGSWPPATTVAEPESVATGEITPEIELDSTAPVALPVTAGVPHLATAPGEADVPALPGIPAQPAALPIHAGIPAPPGIPAQHAAIPTQPGIPAQPDALPAPLPPVLSSFFEVLP